MIAADNFEGSLDGAVGFDIAGWAWRPQTPAKPALVEIVLGKRVIATTRADRFRGDLSDAGKREGLCAFRIAIGRLGLSGPATLDIRSHGAALGQVELTAELVAAANTYAALVPAGEDATVDPGEISPHPPTMLPVKLGGPAGVVGWLDRFDETGVSGWAYKPDGDGKPLQLHVVFARNVIGQIDANAWRGDLAETHQRAARAGFDVPPPPRLLDGRPRVIDLRLGEDGPSLLDAPLIVQCAATDRWLPSAIRRREQAEKMIVAENFEGYLDGAVGFDIAGWAWRPQAPVEPALVELVIGKRVIATTKADRLRADLTDADKRGGFCAFRIAIGRLGLTGPATLDIRSHGVELGEVVLTAEQVTAANTYAARLSASQDITVDPGEISPHEPTTLPIKLGGPAGIRGWIDRFDETGVGGWAYDPEGGSKPVRLRVMFARDVIGHIDARGWRDDLAEMRQGDGRAGIDAPPPPRLLDGRPRAIDLRLGENGPSVLDAPLIVQCAPTDKWTATATAAPARRKKLIPGPVEISFIVLFYNMRREATRTLTSLSRAFQRNIDDVEYEVICIDNGSKVPLEADWIESFGPEFRLFKPTAVKPSPVFALNEAAKAAKGKRVALMIDGAHVVTPGVIREALDAFKETPDAVVGLRQWFFGGDQRWFSQVGYTREQEDVIFDKIGWPADGYRLFEVSSPMMPTPSPWFDSASESNCTIMPRTLFERIGGYDEGFDIPGGSLANLDLFTRAVETPGVTPIMLLGEASFHQFHGGTTTNIDEDQKNAEVRRYKNAFTHRRGERLRHLMADKIRYRGHMPTSEATVTRQRPVVRGFTGVTGKVRPTDPYLYFDDGAKDYLNGYAVEAGVPEQTRWMGKPTGLAAGDLVNLQEIMGNVRPTRIVAVNAPEGLKLYLQSMLKLFDIPDAQLVLVGGPGDAIPGPARSEAALAKVREAVGLADDVLVIFRADPDDELPVDAVQAYGRFVSRLSYMIVTGTTSGQPWLGYSTRWIRKAAQLLASTGEFRIDPSFEFHLVTACSWGYLRRTGGRQDQDDGEYNAALDDLSTL